MRKRLQKFGVDQHFLGLVKRTDNILHTPEIDRSLSSDGRIDLRKEGCGNVIEINSPHIGRCRKTGEVAYDEEVDLAAYDRAVGMGEVS